MSDLVLKIAPIAEAKSLKSQIHAQLKSAITAMSIYDDNAELRLDERALSARLGISRTPLREALVQLESEGLVRVLPRRGVFIVRKTKAEILEMITVWAALEGMAARLACAVATDGELAELRELQQNFYADGAIHEHIGEYSDANIRFHQTIVRLSRCRLIGEMTAGLFSHVRAIRQRTIFERDRVQRSLVDHMQIIEALEARLPERAESLVVAHTLRLRDHVERHVELP
jgi:DNA-binding GntR family transcriptional regulator